ncbi:hypothetical protein QBC34DRAFT_392374 [Podospora aff. communis PSN243]|uniref:Secreted protein n=1 Tax=Podospora aff. communis PSN243 TaxID=3040156 RepID=A0AAV9H1X3_9PEZI|nr:hypothetical protein QBC34DRAFT_392374 [Podospora aff. communis PSN243]
MFSSLLRLATSMTVCRLVVAGTTRGGQLLIAHRSRTRFGAFRPAKPRSLITPSSQPPIPVSGRSIGTVSSRRCRQSFRHNIPPPHRIARVSLLCHPFSAHDLAQQPHHVLQPPTETREPRHMALLPKHRHCASRFGWSTAMWSTCRCGGLPVSRQIERLFYEIQRVIREALNSSVAVDCILIYDVSCWGQPD